MAVRAFPLLGRAGVELYSVEFFLKGLGNKRTSLAVLDKAPDSIGKAVDWAKNFEANDHYYSSREISWQEYVRKTTL